MLGVRDIRKLIAGVALIAAAVVLPGPALLAASQVEAPALVQSGIPSLDEIMSQARDAMRADPKTTISLAQKVEAQVRSWPHSDKARLVIAQTQWLQAEAYLRLNDPDRAAALVARALPSLKSIQGPVKLRGDLLMTRGGVNQARADVAGALSDYQTAHNIFAQLGQTRSQAIALQNIASLYRQAGDQPTAMKYDQQSVDVYPGDPGLAVSTHNNQGNALRQLGRPAEAEAEYRKALTVAEQMGSPLLKTRILANMARGQLEANAVDRAQITLADAMKLARGSPDAASYLPQLSAIQAQAAYQKGDYHRAAVLIAQSFRGVDLTATGLAYRDSHQTAYLTYEKLGRFDLALQHLQAMKRIDDATAKLAASTNTALMAARFDYANQNLKISQLRQRELQRNIEFERARAQSQRTLFIGLAIATLVGVSMLAFGLITIRRSRNEVRAANIDLAATNVALEKALAAKTEFLATTSHEIRTPLNGILGMTQVMLADRKLEPDLRDRISVVHGAGVTMRALVDDILDVAKMESGNMTLEHVPFDLRGTLGDVSRLWQEQAPTKGIAFDLNLDDCPTMVEGDSARLRQIAFNLLSNAFKFTEKGSVRLRAWTEGDRLKLTVTDTGIGIPEEKQQLIFESFRQADAGTTRRFGGTGLGLAICRNLARAMGGNITLASRPGEGACFTVDLPFVQAPEIERVDEAGKCATLLVVDRNPITRSMLKALFEPLVDRIELAGSVDDAMAILERGGISQVLVDDGVAKGAEAPVEELARLVAAAPETNVSLLCVAGDETYRETLANAGFKRIITKPIAGAALVEMLYPADGAEESGGSAPDLVSRAA